jgi:hypothetical protein
LNLFVENTFYGHLTLLKVHFCFEKTFGLDFDQVKILTLHDKGRLDLGTFFFKIIMQSNHATALELLILCNPFTWLWLKLASNTFLQHQ